MRREEWSVDVDEKRKRRNKLSEVEAKVCTRIARFGASKTVNFG